MLPDFPSQKAKLIELWNFYTQKKQSQFLGIFSDVPSHHHHEGNDWIIEREDGSHSVQPYHQASAAFSVSMDEIPDLTPDKIARKLDHVAQEMAKQVEQQLFQTLLQDMEESGRVINHQGQGLDYELILEALESITISFNKDGSPNLPTMFVSPEMGKNIKNDLKSWNEDAELSRRFDVIIERKKEEWRARVVYPQFFGVTTAHAAQLTGRA